MGKNQHVTHRPDGKWQHIGAGNERATGVYDTQREAIDSARDAAIKQQSELVIHGKNGQIREKNSYGNDPYPPKG